MPVVTLSWERMWTNAPASFNFTTTRVARVVLVLWVIWLRMRTLNFSSLTRKIATDLWHRPFKPSRSMAQTIELAQVSHCPSLQSLQQHPSYFCRRQREIIWKHWKKNTKIDGNQKSYLKLMHLLLLTPLVYLILRLWRSIKSGLETFLTPTWMAVCISDTHLLSPKSNLQPVISVCWVNEFCFLTAFTLLACP